MLKKYFCMVSIVVAGLFTFTNTAVAHHSFAAIWDESKEFEVTGVLSKVRWMNPHSYFHVDVTAANGDVETYRFENFPPAMLKGLGMSKKMMTGKVGQEVTVFYNPAWDETETIGYGRVFEFVGGPNIVFTGSSRGGGVSGEPTLGAGVTQ